MFPYHRFKLTREAALLAMISAAFSTAGYGAAGRVDFVVGEVNATSRDGKVRPLTKGATFDVGDTIGTGANGRAQLRFTDGALSSIQPETQFRIDEYNYAGRADGSEKGFFSLVKGGLRTITGLIGKANRNTYRVATPTATIGIRGTEYLAREGNSLSVSVGEGIIEVCNAAGCLSVADGQTIFVRDPNTPPVFTLIKPKDSPPPPPKPGGTTGLNPQENSDTQPTPQPPPNTPPECDRATQTCDTTVGGGEVTPPLPPPPPATVTFTGVGAFALNGATKLILEEGSATLLEATNEAIAFQNASAAEFLSIGTATVSESFFDGTIGLGRWSNGTINATADFGSGPESVALALGPNQGLHYVFGTPTPVMPTSGVGTYSLLAATKATSADGSLGLGTFSCGGSGCLGVDFSTGKVGVDFNVNFASAGYNVQSTGGLANLSSSEIQVFSPVFAGVNIPTTGTGAACASVVCATDVVGFFAGVDATRAGMAYQINDTQKIHGTAALEQTSLVLPPPPAAGLQNGAGYMLVYSVDGGGGFPQIVTATFDSSTAPSRLTGFDDGIYNTTRGTATTPSADSGSDNIIAWGRWTNGTMGGTNPNPASLGPNQSLHYVVGLPTPTADLTGLRTSNSVATYSLLGATTPSFSDGVGGGLGTGSLSGSLTAYFGLSTLNADLSLNFPSASGGPAAFIISGPLNHQTDSGTFFGSPSVGGPPAYCSSGCSSQVSGFFAGANAARAGLQYGVNVSSPSVFIIGGTAAFTQGSVSTPSGLPSAPGYAVAYVEPTPRIGYVPYANATFNSSSAPSQLTAFDVFGLNATRNTNTSADTGSDNIIGWGRWTGGAVGGTFFSGIPSPFTGSQSLHYVVGAPTPSSDMIALGSTTATYSLLGYTTPTFNNSTGDVLLGTGGTLSGSLSANFGAGTVTTSGMSVNFPNASGGAQTFGVTGSATFSSGSPFFSGSLTASNPTYCSLGCAGAVNGFFAGANAARAGLTYDVNAATFRVQGAAAFTKN